MPKADKESERLREILAKVHATADRFQWVAYGRGPAGKWNDEQYRRQMGMMIDEIKKIAAEGLAETKSCR